MGVAHSVDEDEEHTEVEMQKLAARQSFETLATGGFTPLSLGFLFVLLVPFSLLISSPLYTSFSIPLSFTSPVPRAIADMMALVAASMPLDVAVCALTLLLFPQAYCVCL
jgi:hypothetical protein